MKPYTTPYQATSRQPEWRGGGLVLRSAMRSPFLRLGMLCYGENAPDESLARGLQIRSGAIPSDGLTYLFQPFLNSRNREIRALRILAPSSKVGPKYRLCWDKPLALRSAMSLADVSDMCFVS